MWYLVFSLAATNRWSLRRWRPIASFAKFLNSNKRWRNLPDLEKIVLLIILPQNLFVFISMTIWQLIIQSALLMLRFIVTNNLIIFIFKIKQNEWNYFLFLFSNYIFLHKRYIILTIHLFVHLRLFDRLQFVHTRAQLYDKTNLLRAWSRGFVRDARWT